MLIATAPRPAELRMGERCKKAGLKSTQLHLPAEGRIENVADAIDLQKLKK
jgi:hypothetical protein